MRALSKILLLVIVFSLSYAVMSSAMPNRNIVKLSGKWNFCVDSLQIGDSQNWGVAGLPAKLTRSVSVPHAWNAEKGLEKYWGICWYERTFEISKAALKKTNLLQFDAVYHDATIFINGKKAGEHIGSGYNRFFINITPFLKVGINTVIVRVDNSPSRSNIPFLKSFDWANDGGIYRNVYLVTTQPQAIQYIHVDALPDGKKGIANIRVSFLDPAKLENSTIKLSAVISEENQKTKKQIYDSELNGKYENGCFITKLKFDDINPWHFDSPNLYKITIRLIADGIEKDKYSTVFGFRSIKIVNDRYVLNGEPMRLMGVEWMPGSSLKRGMAETTADLEKNLNLMKNANCIFTRFHWQQDEYVFDWCDRHGILVQEEIPYWGKAMNLNDTLLNKGFQHLDEMINNHYNHPSIIAWGIGNELTSRNQQTISILKKLYQHAKNLDSTRLVNYVSNRLDDGVTNANDDKSLSDASSNFDMMMFNEYYSTWYGKTLDSISSGLDRIAKRYPNKPITISECGICEPVFKGGDPRRCKEMVIQNKIYGSKKYIAGEIYFCLNDYRTHLGEDLTYSYPQRVHGVCDIHLNPKPSYDTLKNISSPIIVKSIAADGNEVVISLLGKTGVPSYIVRDYTLAVGNQKIKIDKLAPGEEKTFNIKTDAKEFKIIRPTGFNVLNIKFR